jgi:hypothetical protein
VDHQSLALDVKILALTALAVFKREGISHAGSATMPEFRGSPAPQETDAAPSAQFGGSPQDRAKNI